MSGKLDQSLDEIMKDSKAAGGNKRRGRVSTRKAAIKSKAATTAAVAPAGGIQKKTKSSAKPPRGPAAAAPTTGISKILVTNMPSDVTDALLKEYFHASIGSVKHVAVNYGPNGVSRGSATVTFSDPNCAAKAVKLDGTMIDKRPLRIEVLVGAKSLPAIAQQSRSLAERVSKPKNVTKEKPKQAAGAKGATNGAANGASKDGRAAKKKSGRAGKPKPKTAEELDAEMQDYFGGGETNGAPTNGTVEPVAAADGGDTGMVDEVL